MTAPANRTAPIRAAVLEGLALWRVVWPRSVPGDPTDLAALAEAYLDAVVGRDVEAVRSAMRALRSECEFLPKPGELRKRVREIEREQAPPVLVDRTDETDPARGRCQACGQVVEWDWHRVIDGRTDRIGLACVVGTHVDLVRTARVLGCDETTLRRRLGATLGGHHG